MRKFCRFLRLIGCWLCLALPSLATANSLQWNEARDQMSADVSGQPLEDLLTQVATTTGWHVYMEQDSASMAPVKFKNRPTGEALRLLLGDLNFAIVPETNGITHLYVFRTAMGNATRLIAGELRKRHARRVPNQIIVQLKPGAKIDDLARRLGAKVVGSIPGLNVYLLQFADAASTDAALAQLSSNSDTASVDYNYYMDPFPVTQAGVASGVGTPELQLKPPPVDCNRVVIGLVDTGIQTLGNGLDDFVTKRLSVTGDSTTANTDTTSGTTTAPSSTPTHATMMANDILGTLSSVTKGKTSAQIVSVNVFGSDAQTSTFNVAAGIVMAANNGATIINLSLGSSGDSSVLQNVVSEVAAKGIGMVAASGNDPTGQPLYPAAYQGVTAVTALQPDGQIAPYANVFPGVQVAAPGTSVMNYGGNTWVSQGTSDATAFATGTAAGLADNACQSWSQLQSTLQSQMALPASQ